MTPQMRGTKSIETGTLMRKSVAPLPAMEAYKRRSQQPALGVPSVHQWSKGSGETRAEEAH